MHGSASVWLIFLRAFAQQEPFSAGWPAEEEGEDDDADGEEDEEDEEEDERRGGRRAKDNGDEEYEDTKVD